MPLELSSRFMHGRYRSLDRRAPDEPCLGLTGADAALSIPGDYPVAGAVREPE